MLIKINDILNALDGINIKGALHIGAHDCQELPFYINDLKIPKSSIVWIDALESKVALGELNGNKVYHATITDKDDENITFNVSNNEQSSSVLEFKTHATQHPEVNFVKTIIQKTVTIDTFFTRNGLDPSDYDFWNFDIQGAELLALQGAPNSIKFVKAMYLEVNNDELYKDCVLINQIDCFLEYHGFKRVLTKMTGWGWGDALYVRTN